MRRVAFIVVAALVLASCSQPSLEEVAIVQYSADGSTIALTLNICHAQQQSITVDETDRAVTVTVSARAQGSNRDLCTDGVEVELKAPLGDRRVIDGSTGAEVATRDF